MPSRRLEESLQPYFDDPDGKVLPVCLPSAPCGGAEDKPECFPAQSLAHLAGWGVLKSGKSNRPEVVHYVNVPVVSNTECAKNYGKIGLTVTKNMVCAGLTAGGKDTCQVSRGGAEMAGGTATRNVC